ncbi:MAG: hypothetical protein JWR33_327 [Naasia sp.]|jgi:hypothetical protein|uniref:hypothetical protein n=1 Tax=Naasia sp. TaxID=2546198 RepID=UPI00262D5E2F|nr:hypothetical protein [Naasia sp.]MCU1569586.1 hypothetical protein [Naasia sp.]
MTARVLLETMATVLLTLLFLVLAAGLIAVSSGSAPLNGFLRDGPATVFGILALPLLVWAGVLATANALGRKRTPRARFLINALLTVVITVLTLGSWAVFAGTAGGFGQLVFAIAAIQSLSFGVCGIVALALTHFGFFSGRSGRPAVA